MIACVVLCMSHWEVRHVWELWREGPTSQVVVT
jgi:hypothetical protein